MTKQSWAREDQISAAELDELRIEIAATMDDHDKVERKNSSWRQRFFPPKPQPSPNSVVRQRMRSLRSDNDNDNEPLNHSSAEAMAEPSTQQTVCTSCDQTHHHHFAPQRFDTVEHSLGAINDLACFLDKAPRSIWLALEGIFTTRQTTSAPALSRHRVSILARVLPAAVALLSLAFTLLHFLLPDHQTDAGYTPVFSELGFIVFVTLFTTITFFVLAAVTLVMKSSLQERFLNGVSRLVNWSIPITLSFFMASPDFLLLFQDLAGGNSTNVAGVESILETHQGVVETLYWTVLVYIAIYIGIFFSSIAFSKVFQEQREYVHRHEVLRDVIPILVSEAQSIRPTRLFRVHHSTEQNN